MRFAFIIVICVTGCASFPELDGTITDAARAAPYPTLGRKPTVTDVIPGESIDPALQSRIDALSARADALRAIEFGALQ